MAGLLDYLNTPGGMGLLSAAVGGMAGARRGTPWNNAGRAGLAGLTGYSQGLEEQKAAQKEAERKAFGQKLAAMVAPPVATPDQYRVGGQTFGNPEAARSAATSQNSVLNLPQSLPGLGMMNAPKRPMVNLADSGSSNEAGAPAAPAQFDIASYGGEPQQIEKVPGQQPQQSPMQIAQFLMSSDVPEYQQMGLKMYTDLATKEPPKPIALGKTLVDPYTGKTIAVDATWKDEQAAQREQRMQELQLRLQDQQLSRADSAALRREMAYMQDSARRDALQLRADDMNAKREAKAETANLTKQSQIASFDTMLGTLGRLKQHPGLSRSVGIPGMLPTIPGSDSANFQAELNTFQSQAFVPMVAQLKGMGALSDAEGRKLTAAVGALDPKMGEQAFRESVDRIINDMEMARSRVSGQPVSKPSGNAAYQEYVSAYKQAKTQQQRDAITARARQNGVVK